MEYVRNTWYPVAFSSDITHSLTRRTVVEEHLALYRTRANEVVALEDLCPHRLLPLSMGRLLDDAVQCGYHGMTFDRSGKCIRIPGQRVVPPNARVKAFPVVENLGLVWVWPGDPAHADKTKVFDLPQYHDPGWTTTHGDALHIRASYLSICDNLIDPSHVSFVHLSTIGSSASEDVPVKTEQRGNTVLAWRWILDAPPVPVVAKLGRFKGNVDRWHYYYLHAPSVAVIDFGSSEPGAIGPDGDRSRGMQLFSCHFITPVDGHNTVDHWMHMRNFAPGDRAMSESIKAEFRAAFSEDKTILEAIQHEEDRHGVNRRKVKLALDASAVRLHRVIEQLIAEETRPLPTNMHST